MGPQDSAPLQDNPTLTFDTLWQIEGVDPSYFDLMDVNVIPVGGSSTTVWQLNPSYDGGTCKDSYASVTGFDGTPEVTNPSVDLSQFANETVELQFSFNTVDSLYNAYLGWQIKNIEITGDSNGIPATFFSDAVSTGDANFTNNSEYGTAPGWHVVSSAALGGPAWWYGNNATGTYQTP